ncbi:MAG: histidinol-phosphate transaminase, partial [Firmicutes bacterium]|nr:histidinol-phosphate transaminase [Bacillota bacterium]
ESPYGLPAELQAQIYKNIGPETFNRYPDPGAEELVKEISSCYKLPPEQIMVGNGSDEMILNLMLTFGVGNRVIVTPPTFSMYGIHARVAGAEVVAVPREQNFELVTDDIIRAADGAGLVVICSPNNPSGNSSSTEQIAAILAGCRCPVAVDQAYLEFGGVDMQPLLADYNNLVILRTMSKAYSLAGLRVGYLFADPGIIHYLLKVKQPFNLNNFSQIAAREVLRHRELFAQQIAQIAEEREKMYLALQAIPNLTVYPSDANYLLFAAHGQAAGIYQGLLQQKVQIRNFSEPPLAHCLRVTVGTPEENKIFLSALRKVIGILGEKKND